LAGRGGEQVKGVSLAARLADGGRATGWFEAQIVQTGRLPLFFFFIAFLVGFTFIRLSVRLIRAQVKWWPGNITSGDTHVHHVVFGVVFMVVGGVAGFAVPAHSVGWRATAAALFGVGTALVLDEFALILHLRDVYWSSAGRVSIDAVFIAGGVTALLLVGITPAGVQDVRSYLNLSSGGSALASLLITLTLLFAFAAITLLKGKIWTGLFGLFVPMLYLVGALRLARPHSPWARWRYQRKPAKLERAQRREQRFREPVIRAKTRLQDLVAGYRPEQSIDGAPQERDGPLASASDHRPGVSQVRDERRLRHLRSPPPDRAGIGLLEQADATAEQHRHQMDIKLIDQAGGQALAPGRAPHHDHVPVPCGRPRPLQGRGEPVGDKREGSAGHAQVTAWPVGEHETGHRKRDVSPVPQPHVEDAPPHDDRADTGKQFPDDPGVRRVRRARRGDARSLSVRREHPLVQPLAVLTDRPAFRVIIRSRDEPVDRHADIDDQSAHDRLLVLACHPLDETASARSTR
jgi:hypothetical protein